MQLDWITAWILHIPPYAVVQSVLFKQLSRCRVPRPQKCGSAPLCVRAALQDLSEQAQCLFLRFFLRKGPWFRLSTAQYSELSDAAAAAAELEAASFAAVTASTADPKLLMELGQTLTVAELQQLLGALHLLGRGNKGQLLKQLGKACREGGPASEVRVTTLS